MKKKYLKMLFGGGVTGVRPVTIGGREFGIGGSGVATGGSVGGTGVGSGTIGETDLVSGIEAGMGATGSIGGKVEIVSKTGS